MSPWNALRADTWRQVDQYSLALMLKTALFSRAFRVIFTMRLCQGIASAPRIIRVTLPLFRLFHHLAASRAGMDLNWHTEIGGGLALTHGWGLVVSREAKIGCNVTLFNGVTIGRRDRISHEGTRTTEYPVIEDEVWIGPHAIIVGGVVIGRGSRIGGGAFVTENVPPHSVVMGNPAVITDNNCMPDVMNPAPVELMA